MISGRTTNFFHKRQIFFVQMGGYDLHTNQGGGLPGQAHYNLLRDLSRGLAGFSGGL